MSADRVGFARLRVPAVVRIHKLKEELQRVIVPNKRELCSQLRSEVRDELTNCLFSILTSLGAEKHWAHERELQRTDKEYRRWVQ